MKKKTSKKLVNQQTDELLRLKEFRAPKISAAHVVPSHIVAPRQQRQPVHLGDGNNYGGGAAARGEKTLTAEEARELINRLT